MTQKRQSSSGTIMLRGFQCVMLVGAVALLASKIEFRGIYPGVLCLLCIVMSEIDASRSSIPVWVKAVGWAIRLPCWSGIMFFVDFYNKERVGLFGIVFLVLVWVIGYEVFFTEEF